MSTTSAQGFASPPGTRPRKSFRLILRVFHFAAVFIAALFPGFGSGPRPDGPRPGQPHSPVLCVNPGLSVGAIHESPALPIPTAPGMMRQPRSYGFP